MKFFSKIQIFGVALATLVALSLTACGESKGGGENKEQSKEQSKEENKKENSQLSAYAKKQCPQCVFVAEYRYEASDVGLWDGSYLGYFTADDYRKARKNPGTFDSRIEEREAFQVRFDERFKIKTTVQKYKVRDDYKPENEWRGRSFTEHAITLLSMPEGVKKVAMSVNESRLEDFTAPQQTQKVYGYGDSLFLQTNALYDGKKFYIKPREVKQNNANETPSTQSADEAKASTSEQEIHNTNENSSEVPNVTQTTEQVKPSFDCAKASTNAEKLVCSDNELANLDNELSKAYTNARNLLDNASKKQLTSEQKAWLETYNQCADRECVKQSLQKRIELLKNTDTRIYLETKDEFVNLRKAPNGEILTPIYKKDFDKIILKRLGVEDKWLKVLYFPPNVSDEKEALTGYIHNSQIK